MGESLWCEKFKKGFLRPEKYEKITMRINSYHDTHTKKGNQEGIYIDELYISYNWQRTHSLIQDLFY